MPLKPIARNDQHPILCEAERQLRQYFAGERQQFDMPYDTVGTAFQKKVWQALLTIPFGETRSYLQIAEQIGNPKAVRAVGAANGKIRCRSWRPVIALSAATVSSPALLAAGGKSVSA